MPSAELTSAQAPQEPVADPNTPHPRSPHTAVTIHWAGFGPFVHPEAADLEATASPRLSAAAARRVLRCGTRG
jgi:hypothetical protein